MHGKTGARSSMIWKMDLFMSARSRSHGLSRRNGTASAATIPVQKERKTN